MNIGIKAVASYRPKILINNLEKGRKLAATESFIREKTGMVTISQRERGQDTSDLAMHSVETLFEKHRLAPDTIDCLVLITQNPDGMGLPHASAILHQKLSLASSCAVFDVSLGCSGYVHGLSIVKGFMESQGFKSGLLVTCDPYSKVIDQNDRDTALLFGDGATATWLTDNPTWYIGPGDFGIISDQTGALAVDSEGRLTMNGRAVFNFASRQVPSSIKRVLKKAGLEMQQIDQVLLHQGSRYIVDTLAKRIGAEGKTPFAASEYGNTVSSSIPMLLAEQVPNDAVRILISGFGVGLAWATCLLEKNK